MAIRGALTHRKTRRLARLLQVQIPCALGVMEAIWHVTADQCPDGAIGTLSNQDIADEMFWDGDADELVRDLIASGVLDEHPEHRLVVHGWSERATDAIHMSLARKGLYFADGSKPRMTRMGAKDREDAEATYAPPQAEKAHKSAQRAHNGASLRTESAPPSHAMPCHADAMPSPPLPSQSPPPPEPRTRMASANAPKANRSASSEASERAWGEFLAVYPDRDGDRKTAPGRTVYLATLRSGVPPDEILDGAQRYRAWCKATGTFGTQFVQQIPTWLRSLSWKEPWSAVKARPRGREPTAAPSLEEQHAALMADYHAKYPEESTREP